MDQKYPYTLVDILRMLADEHESPEKKKRREDEAEMYKRWLMNRFYSGEPNTSGYDLPPRPGMKPPAPIRPQVPSLPLGTFPVMPPGSNYQPFNGMI